MCYIFEFSILILFLYLKGWYAMLLVRDDVTDDGTRLPMSNLFTRDLKTPSWILEEKTDSSKEFQSLSVRRKLEEKRLIISKTLQFENGV